jgi:hypothetical protein
MHVAWGDNERNLVKDASVKAAEMLEAGGIKNIKLRSEVHGRRSKEISPQSVSANS